MRSIQKRAENISQKKPNASTYVCLSEAVSEQGFCDRRIASAFNQLVEKGDYDESIKGSLLRCLYERTKPIEACMKRG